MENWPMIADKLKLDSRGNAADLLMEKFRAMILSGQIEAGYVFPNENVLCQQLCVSRSTLREAYKALESTGFIRRVKGHGTVVNDFSAISQSAPFSTSIQLSDLDDLMEFREMVESELARLAAERATAENVSRIGDALEHMKRNINNISKLTYYDTKFHMEIAYASGNKLLINTMKNVEATFSKGMYSAYMVDTEANIQEAIAYHTDILCAIGRRDAASAQEVMRRHIKSVGKRLGVQLDSNRADLQD